MAKKGRKLGLGDLIESALSTVGITPDRVTKLIGRDCGCKKRKEWLNRITLWSKKVPTLDPEEARRHFEQMEKEKEDLK